MELNEPQLFFIAVVLGLASLFISIIDEIDVGDKYMTICYGKAVPDSGVSNLFKYDIVSEYDYKSCNILIVVERDYNYTQVYKNLINFVYKTNLDWYRLNGLSDNLIEDLNESFGS